MTNWTFGLLAVAQAVLWIPVLLHFFRQWWKRRNPISLAIMLLVMMAVYVGTMPVWLASTSVAWISTAVLVVDILVCANFYVAFGWSRLKFSDAREHKN